MAMTNLQHFLLLLFAYVTVVSSNPDSTQWTPCSKTCGHGTRTAKNGNWVMACAAFDCPEHQNTLKIPQKCMVFVIDRSARTGQFRETIARQIVIDEINYLDMIVEEAEKKNVKISLVMYSSKVDSVDFFAGYTLERAQYITEAIWNMPFTPDAYGVALADALCTASEILHECSAESTQQMTVIVSNGNTKGSEHYRDCIDRAYEEPHHVNVIVIGNDVTSGERELLGNGDAKAVEVIPLQDQNGKRSLQKQTKGSFLTTIDWGGTLAEITVSVTEEITAVDCEVVYYTSCDQPCNHGLYEANVTCDGYLNGIWRLRFTSYQTNICCIQPCTPSPGSPTPATTPPSTGGGGVTNPTTTTTTPPPPTGPIEISGDGTFDLGNQFPQTPLGPCWQYPAGPSP